MSTLQFGLFFAALLIGYVLVHIRLMRFETYLREVSALKVVNERLQGVADVMTRVDLGRVEERLDAIGVQVEELARIGERVELALERVREHSAPAVAAPESAADRIRALVETRLFSLGYRRLRLLSDLAGVDPGDEVEVTVECEKNQMAFKGKVITCAGEIRDINLQSVTQAFP